MPSLSFLIPATLGTAAVAAFAYLNRTKPSYTHPVTVLHPSHHPGGSEHVRCDRCGQEFVSPSKRFVDDNWRLGVRPGDLIPMDRSYMEYVGCTDECKKTVPRFSNPNLVPCRP